MNGSGADERTGKFQAGASEHLRTLRLVQKSYVDEAEVRGTYQRSLIRAGRDLSAVWMILATARWYRADVRSAVGEISVTASTKELKGTAPSHQMVILHDQGSQAKIIGR
jgi:hypothetical protein